jgi:four helix bundle protein
MTERDLAERLFKFAVDVILAVRTLPRSAEFKVITYQLVKSSSSSGANYEEAQAAVSVSDFSNKVAISLKEMRESNFWIRLLIKTCPNPTPWEALEKESVELKKILGSIYTKTSKKRP